MMDKQNRKELINAYKDRKATGGVCAIKNTATGRLLLAATADLQGYQNRFAFAKQVGSCVDNRLETDWHKYGAAAFELEVLETLEQSPTQTAAEFRADVKALRELWLERYDENLLYEKGSG